MKLTKSQIKAILIALIIISIAFIIALFILSPIVPKENKLIGGIAILIAFGLIMFSLQKLEAMKEAEEDLYVRRKF